MSWLSAWTPFHTRFFSLFLPFDADSVKVGNSFCKRNLLFNNFPNERRYARRGRGRESVLMCFELTMRWQLLSHEMRMIWFTTIPLHGRQIFNNNIFNTSNGNHNKFQSAVAFLLKVERIFQNCFEFILFWIKNLDSYWFWFVLFLIRNIFDSYCVWFRALLNEFEEFPSFWNLWLWSHLNGGMKINLRAFS